MKFLSVYGTKATKICYKEGPEKEVTFIRGKQTNALQRLGDGSMLKAPDVFAKVSFPPLTWWLTAACNFSSKGSKPS